jgi:hypothetical protein
MIRALFLLLLLGICLGAGWLGFSIYRVKNDKRLMPVERMLNRLEGYVANPKVFPKLAARIGSTLDAQIGRCEYMTLPEQDGLAAPPRPILDRIFPFSQVVNLSDAGVLCQFNNYGEPFMMMPLPKTDIFLERRPGRAPRFEFKDGLLWISSNKFHLEWDVPGMRIQITSPVPTVVSISRTTMLTINIQSGILDLEPMREISNAPIEPVLVSTTEKSELRSGGKPIAKMGQSITLLPTGFTNKTNPAGAPPATTTATTTQAAPAPPPPPAPATQK